MPTLSSSQYMESLQFSIQELQRLSSHNLDKPVLDCPGWAVQDLIAHVGKVFAMVDAVVVPRSLVRVGPGAEAVAPQGVELGSWFATRCDSVLQSLSGVSPDEKMWTWSRQQTAGFYFRRMANEAAVHVCDLQRALGIEASMNREIACDGIDELYTEMLPFWAQRNQTELPQGTLHLHSTDGPGEWLLSPHGFELEVQHAHAKGDVAWRGSAVNLILAGWGRKDVNLEILGDVAVSDQWNSCAP
ncbi:MAG: maleylpyruvate isomerase family mycothiol-dependent enzyme [Actinomycetes bacterium]